MSTTGLSTHNTNTDDTGRTTGFGNTFTGTGTGSWADSTHSVIWMSRDGKSQALPYLRRPRASQYASLLVAALLTLAAASNLIDVYGSATSWALAAIPATIIGSLVALAGTVPALRLWWQMLFMAVAQLVVGPVLFLNDTTIAHIVPTLRTLTQGWMNMLGSFKFILSVEPPTGTADGCLLAVWTICLWFALLTGIFAVTEDGRFTMIAIIPVTANLAICALLGSSSGYYRMFVGTIMALILVIWISARWKLLELGRWLSSVVIVVLSVALAIGGCLVVDQDRTILRDHYDPPLSPYNYTSPLSGMRSYITNSKDDVLLTVENLPAGSSVRLAVMDRFDGNVWNLSDSTMSSDSSNYRRVGTSITNNAEEEIHRHIHRGQRTQRLLAAHGRSRIQRDIRQQRKLRLVLLQQRHHVGHLPLTHLRGLTYTKPASCQRFPPTNRSPKQTRPPSASQKPKMCPTA